MVAGQVLGESDMMVDAVDPGRVALLRRFVTQSCADAEVALLTGSWACGGGFSASDLDVVLLFRVLPDGAWRETTEFEGQIIEAFAHDPGTVRYFCREVDRPSGWPALPMMIVEGIPVLPQTSALLDEARQTALETLMLGPLPLAPEVVQAPLYDNRRGHDIV
jgi:hypothetical protein